MRKKILALSILLILSINIAQALALETKDLLPKEVIVKVWTDKQFYKPGEQGWLRIIVFNNDVKDYYIKNITVEYPWWYSYINGEWKGFEIIEPEKDTLRIGEMYEKNVPINVPSEGRIRPGTYDIEVTVNLNEATIQKEAIIEIIYDYPSSIEGMDKIVTLLAVQIILTVISALVIAAAIYLSLRKPVRPTPPPVPPSEEEKT